MLNTMTVTKAAGAVLGSLLFLLLVNWGATSLYHVGGGHVAEGEEHAQAYTIEVAGADEGDAGAEAEGEPGMDFLALLSEADPAAGEKAFGKCRACHKLDGSAATGPYLNGVVGRPVASVEGYAYSEAMAGHGGEWDPETLQAFLENPKGVVPGTKMAFAGLKRADERADLIAYLQSVGG